MYNKQSDSAASGSSNYIVPPSYEDSVDRHIFIRDSQHFRDIIESYWMLSTVSRDQIKSLTIDDWIDRSMLEDVSAHIAKRQWPLSRMGLFPNLETLTLSYKYLSGLVPEPLSIFSTEAAETSKLLKCLVNRAPHVRLMLHDHSTVVAERCKDLGTLGIFKSRCQA